MKTNPDDPSATASLTLTDQQVMDTLHRQQRRLRWLTVTAVVLWSLAVLTSVGVLVFYSVFYAPKERQVLDDYGTYGHLRERSALVTESESAASRPPTPGEKALGLQFTMSWIMMKVVLFVAVSVIILSCGTLATLLLVIFNRRVTLRQINHSLAQISQQLKALQASRPAP
jgi:hypothetical protein